MINAEDAISSIFAKVDDFTGRAVGAGILHPGTALAILSEFSHHSARIAAVELVATRTEAAAAKVKGLGSGLSEAEERTRSFFEGRVD